MTALAGVVVALPSADRVVTAVTSPPSAWTATTRSPIRTSPPAAATRSRHRSHIIPGPYFGYWNSSMRLVISFWLRRGSREFVIALPSESAFTRWAAQSAGIWLTGTPQTFSVYVLKNRR